VNKQQIYKHLQHFPIAWYTSALHEQTTTCTTYLVLDWNILDSNWDIETWFLTEMVIGYITGMA
jgi:hypothetical protein